jgi:polygalacturonase
MVEAEGRSLLLFHTDPSERAPFEGGGRHHYRAGRTYDVGQIELESGEALWIEPGAVVRGVVRAHHAEGIRIGGGGILDGSLVPNGLNPRCVVLGRCSDVLIEDITIVQPQTWTVTLGACKDVRVRNLHEFGEVVGSDGIDIVGSQNVHVTGCFFRNNDDCIAVKSRDMSAIECLRSITPEDVRDVLVEKSIFANDRAGNALEIGHELETELIEDIVFRDLDILHVHGHGAPISIHCGDRATVRNIVFQDIRIEHHYDKFVDIRVMKSRFNRDAERGRIENVLLERIVAHDAGYNRGYTTSQIAGWGPEHPVKNVTFRDVVYLGQKAIGPLDIDLMTRDAEGIVFE